MTIGQIYFDGVLLYNDGERQLGIHVDLDTNDGEVSIETANKDRRGHEKDWRVAVPYGYIDELIDLLKNAKEAYDAKLRGE